MGIEDSSGNILISCDKCKNEKGVELFKSSDGSFYVDFEYVRKTLNWQILENKNETKTKWLCSECKENEQDKGKR